LYLLDSIALLATLWAVFRLLPQPVTGERGSVGLRSVFDGFAYLATRRILLASFLVDIIAMVFGMPRALFPQIATESFGDPASGGTALGLLFAAMSVGAVIGGVFSGWIPRVRRQGRAVLVCVALWGVAMVVFGAVVGVATPDGSAWWLWLALAALAFGGAVDMISAAFRQAILLASGTDQTRGRLQAGFVVVRGGGRWRGARGDRGGDRRDRVPGLPALHGPRRGRSGHRGLTPRAPGPGPSPPAPGRRPRAGPQLAGYCSRVRTRAICAALAASV